MATKKWSVYDNSEEELLSTILGGIHDDIPEDANDVLVGTFMRDDKTGAITDIKFNPVCTVSDLERLLTALQVWDFEPGVLMPLLYESLC